MKNRNLNHSDHWKTPPEFYNKLDAEFHFNFDPCPLYAEFDGLNIEWQSSNYVNPPYSRKLKEAFIRKAWEESKKGKLCVLLLPVSTSTKIFHEVIYPHKVLKTRSIYAIKQAERQYVRLCGFHLEPDKGPVPA